MTVRPSPTANSERIGSELPGSEEGRGTNEAQEFVPQVRTFVRQEAKIPVEFNDGPGESNSAFEAKAQALLERLREQGMSIDELAQLFRMSKSGTWKRVKHIQPKTPEPSIMILKT